MPTTLRSLLEVDAFDLRPAVPLDETMLDRTIAWAHSSDLADPTPWLEPGQLLLTDGAQFIGGRDTAEAAAYVRRLVDLGAAGLGFAVDVIHAAVPPDVVEACTQQGLPLLVVPRATPFLGIIRHIADVAAADRSARLSWSLESQKAVARAAVRDNGLREILRTLSQRLETWVALYGATGEPVRIPGLTSVPGGRSATVDREVRRLLDRGLPASLRTLEEPLATLQTIGQASRLRGVLAVGSATRLGAAESDLVEAVIALASIALEQQRALGHARRRIRSGVLELALADRTAEARRAAKALGAALPETPFLVGMVRDVHAAPSLLEEFEVQSGTRGRAAFFAERGDEVVLLMSPASVPTTTATLKRHGLTLGVSTPVGWSELAQGVREAARAAQTETETGVVRFEDVAAAGILGALRAGGGEELATHLHRRLGELGDVERARLLENARVWLDANTAWDPAARRLGIHRHTLRARIDELGALIGLDLSTFAGRAELWAALQFADATDELSPGADGPRQLF
ncbi:Transcriptional activator PmfR [Microbacterium lemovicicum]|uniref:Transcriptional activator PmfR n=1 Tax=Microbacterium lemovicicum TaxID=1072463 RepID=A0A3Q9J569_9MICO|nr:PucR family transcriptional regulator [Microbacterium lemovicicum]AZS38058.1 Transcriptional activator PmfR [Microbacterium lemovicicum]